jgi:hypothetical protein
MRIAEQDWTLGPDVGDHRAVVGPHPNPEVAFLPRPVILPIVDVSPISAGRFLARWETPSFSRLSGEGCRKSPRHRSADAGSGTRLNSRPLTIGVSNPTRKMATSLPYTRRSTCISTSRRTRRKKTTKSRQKPSAVCGQPCPPRSVRTPVYTWEFGHAASPLRAGRPVLSCSRGTPGRQPP